MNIVPVVIAPCAAVVLAAVASLGSAGELYECTVEGPDIITFKVADSFGTYDMDHYNTGEGYEHWAVATTSGNPGTMVAQWAEQGQGELSPVIGAQYYRIKDGRFEQIGMSWLKHSFCAVSEPMCDCDPTNCDNLGVGCADTYWASLNADADAPRSEINATNGRFVYPFFQAPCGPNARRGKLKVNSLDTEPGQNNGAAYFVEGQYVSVDSPPDYPDEYDYGTQHNNVSYRQIKHNSASNTSPVGDTVTEAAAIMAWENFGATVNQVWTPEADDMVGLMHIGHNVTDNQDGTWTYNYAVHNQNSHNGAGSFTVPISDCVTISNIYFSAPEYHSCEFVSNDDWQVSVTDSEVTWSTEDQASNEWANHLRWGSAYSFGFTADHPPYAAVTSISQWRAPGVLVDMMSVAPVPNCGGCSADVTGDSVIDVNDILLALASYGQNAGGDTNGDGLTDVNDILAILEVYGQSC